MRILGIDYGDSRIGLAQSDSLGIIASGLGAVANKSMRNSIDEIATIAKINEVSKIIIGLPLNMDGTEGDRANKTKAFGKNLEKVSGVSVFYQDERMTSISATRAMDDMGIKKHKQQAQIDTKSAQIILQMYLDKTKF